MIPRWERWLMYALLAGIIALAIDIAVHVRNL
jgi:hypothetical protein